MVSIFKRIARQQPKNMKLQTRMYPFLLFFPILFSTMCKKSALVTPPPTTPRVTDTLPALQYQLVWADEFNGTSIDTTNWNFEKGGNGWGNNEKEYYQEENATTADGNLVITAKKESRNGNPYTSSRMTTQGKREFTYGRLEARIKLPVGQGLWPAFWALGTNIKTVGWPTSGEIDVMEHINADNLIYGTLHWNNNGHVSSGDKMPSTPSEYHVYAVEWDANAIRWYVDSLKFHEVPIVGGVNNTDAFHKPFFLLLNLAVGGNWPGQTVDDTKFPARLYVDYVRVYQKK